MNKKIHVVCIDPQNDFCHPLGALFVPGAQQDAIQIAKLIRGATKHIADIHVTLDSHRHLDVGHPMMWVNSKGENPPPFTIISHDDVVNGNWRPRLPNWLQRALDYTKALEKNGRYALCVWPEHCIIGHTKKIMTPNSIEVEFCGHAVVEPVSSAIEYWEKTRFGAVNYVTKGTNIWTEHYSALQAEVPDPNDPSTMLNTDLLDSWAEADEIWCVGEALSHCYASTFRDAANYFGDDVIAKMVLVTDTTSNVPSFEHLGQSFIEEMTTGRSSAGKEPMRTATVDELLRYLS